MGSEAPPTNGQAQAPEAAPIDPVKKAKKDEKTALKAAKKEKALAKAQAKAAQDAAKKKDGGGKSKKAAAEEAKAKEAAEVEAIIKQTEAIPKGQKKVYSTIEDMPKAYHPRFVEAATYSWWEDCGFFKPSMDSNAENFVIVLPPPNVTGSLHLGHALTDSIQDALTRWHRMSGRNALWVPGLDHASIATQSIVEKTLLKKGIKREELGREKFLAEVHKWVEVYGGKICHQMRRLGTSCDWSRQAYTMDAKLSAAVKEAFLRMHAEGLIYRDVRLVNWDCRLQTAVSDSEVDYTDIAPYSKVKVPGYDQPVEFGVLTSFAYKLEQPYKGPEGNRVDEIVVATTRPETMIGDTGIAVHPDDPRYTQAVGKNVIHPLDGRKIPIVADGVLVDPEFGTGAVKITPAHDPNDFDTGKRHGLRFVNVLTDTGCLNDQGGKFAGLPRFQARVAVVDWLKEIGLFRGTAGNEMRLGTCSRSGDVIEPVIKPQWWVDCKEMGAAAAAAVNDGRLTILPNPKSFLDWIARMRDWCISRQLWWGHRIPAFYYTLAGEPPAAPGSPSERVDHWVVASDAAAAEALVRARHPGSEIASIEQDVDVLDTWFSSGLFPFSVMGWPQETADLAKFYPTSLLETGHDIIFFWVLRMVMMGMKLTGQVPFHTVYLHSMVRDAHGRKMSKSLGNVIDPLEVIEGVSLATLAAKLREGNLAESEIARAEAGQRADFPDGIEECGTDALRFTLLSYLAQGKDLNLDIKRVVANRHWCNKLWNAIRFALLNLGSDFRPSSGFPADPAGLPLACRWILSKLAATVAGTIDGFSAYEFGDTIQGLYSWWQYCLCDVFIELVKPVVQQDDSAPGSAQLKQAYRDTLWLCLDIGLRLLHPVMPFVTEELWQRLPKPSEQQPESIMLAPFPAPQPGWSTRQSEDTMDFLLDTVKAVRALRAEYNLTRERPRLYLQCSSPERAAWLSEHAAAVVAALATAESAEVLPPGSDGAAGKTCATAVVDDTTSVFMELSGTLLDKEIKRLRDQQTTLEGQRGALEKRMSAAGYEKSPDHVQAADKEKAGKLEGELQAVQIALGKLST